jgi:hypothetical protein
VLPHSITIFIPISSATSELAPHWFVEIYVNVVLFCEYCGMRLRGSPAARVYKEKVRAKKNCARNPFILHRCSNPNMSNKTVSTSERSMAMGLIIASIAGLGLSSSIMSENKQAEAQQEPQQQQTQ